VLSAIKETSPLSNIEELNRAICLLDSQECLVENIGAVNLDRLEEDIQTVAEWLNAVPDEALIKEYYWP
jgi:hypothetical protein